MTETRTSQNPKPLSVLEQMARIERQRSRQELAENIFHAILLVVFGLALGTIAFSLAGACTL